MFGIQFWMATDEIVNFGTQPSLSPYSHIFIIGIPSPTHSFTLGLNPSFSANLPYRSHSFNVC